MTFLSSAYFKMSFVSSAIFYNRLVINILGWYISKCEIQRALDRPDIIGGNFIDMFDNIIYKLLTQS